MDPPPLQPHPVTIPPPIHTATATTNHLNCPDSSNSSPRSSQHTDTWDEPLPPVPGAKLRLMCSYNGHIIPRPHDKSLCYVGGETRIVVVDRHSSLSDFHSRLSISLLNGRQFTLKYQLPNEELDSLVSLTTDEDMENMIDEHDRINSTSPLRPARLRLFLFTVKPETVASMGCLLDDAKSETWFVDALNGSGLLPRGLSDTAAVDNLLVLDASHVENLDSSVDLEAQNQSLDGNNKQIIKNTTPEVHSTFSDSPMVENNTSSFESSVSSPSMSNLPPIRVRVEEGTNHMVGLDEQFSQMNVVNLMTAPPPPLPAMITVSSDVGMNSTAVAGENLGSRILSDDERSDHGAPTGLRKPPLPLQAVQRKLDVYNLPSPDSKHAGGYNLPSPDSVASDSSIASAASLSKHMVYQDTIPTANRETRVTAPGTDPQNNIIDPSSQIQMQQVQETMVLPQLQQNQQQQYIQTNAQYIQHPATNQVPMSSYYTIYAPPQQQVIHQQMDHQQYPMYFMPVTQAQPYNLAMQSNISDATSVSTNQQLAPQNQTFVPSSTTYKEMIPPMYPAKTTTPKPEMTANLYRTPAAGTPTMVQVPPNQYQQQYYGLQQMPPPPSQVIPAGSTATANYVYEYAHPAHDHAYYAHPSQYQSMTPAAAMMLAQNSSNIAADNSGQQINTPQP